MDKAQVHYEVFARRKANAGWTLEIATENRAHAVEQAEDMLAEGRAVGVRVSKETLDEETREFRSLVILTLGAVDKVKAKKPRDDQQPLCVTPSDLYSIHARERIGRLLDSWLTREQATPFELLHRPDLIERLDASGMELQHAIQKIAIPEAQERGVGVHEVIRTFQRLIKSAIERVLGDARKGKLPDVDRDGFAQTAERLTQQPDRVYLLGAGVAATLSRGDGWSEKVNRLLDLADAAPQSPAARALAFEVLGQPLAEILGSRAGLADLLGGSQMDLGQTLAAMTRLAAAEEVELLIGIEPAVARVMPPLEGPAARLANWLDGPHFEGVRGAIAKRVLGELNGPRRLRPDDAEGEIHVLRALAMALTAASGRLTPLELVQEAFIERSRMLVRGDFVEAYLGAGRSAIGEVEALLWLAENVTGGANKRAAARWISAVIDALRFEKEMRYGPDSPAAKLAALADLQIAVKRAGFVEEEAAPIREKIGLVGGLVEADAKLVAAVVKAGAPVLHRLTLLLRLAAGEAAPIGPAADRARVEAVRMMRSPMVRAELAATPDAVEPIRDLMQTVWLAA
ncbi:hypothetical protein C5708_06810 [Caulobacter sp. CCUG 60055]|nr:hypothetical protein [Caulobacter sp. CCUG 60055]MBQ1543139.1 hypothetical protein [Caulobacteraceae bacterium]MCI3179961.1 hypothetical protein [Caulobacter sp. CCUG 60055]